MKPSRGAGESGSQSRALSSGLIVAAGILLAAYVCFRAFHLSFTHDESLSYTIIKGNARWLSSANHHPLNTWLMKWASEIGGDGELVLRLPNVLAFAIYFLACRRLMLRVQADLWSCLAGVGLLLLNPFLLDFFSLARGYGLSLAFMMLSLAILLSQTPSESSVQVYHKKAAFTMVSATAALLANLALINFYMAVLLLVFYQYSRLVKHSLLSNTQKLAFAGLMCLASLPVVWAVSNLLRLKAAGELYFGADSLSDTFSTLLASSQYANPGGSLAGFTCLMVIGALILAALAYLSRRRNFGSPLALTTMLLAPIFSGLIVEHYFFDVKYPLERTALYLLPLLGIFFYYGLLHSGSWGRWISVPVSLLLLLNFCLHANLSYTFSWKFDAATKAAAARMETFAAQHKGNDLLTVSNNWLFEPGLNYYIQSRHLPFYPADRSGVRSGTDFCYEFRGVFNDSGYQAIDSFSTTLTTLYRRR